MLSTKIFGNLIGKAASGATWTAILGSATLAFTLAPLKPESNIVLAQSLYKLPFLPSEGGDKGVSVSAGNSGHHIESGQKKKYNQFAWDFELNEGSTVVAARGGKVISLYEGSNSKGGADKNNYVVIGYDDDGDGQYDDSSSLYAHLQLDGALVNVGDLVTQGQPIAKSGNTGSSTGPHLHYSLQDGVPSKNYSNNNG